jgi:MFS family permease
MHYPKSRGKALTRSLGLLGAVAFILQGYDQGLMNGLITLPTFYDQFPQTNAITTTGSAKSRASTIQGTTVAIYEVGAALGAGSCYFLGDVLGRRRMITLAAVVVLVGVTIQSSAFSLGQFITGRVITGMLGISNFLWCLVRTLSWKLIRGFFRFGSGSLYCYDPYVGR